MVSESTSRVSQAPSEPLDTLAFVAAETSQQWAQAHENIMQVNALLQRKDTVLTQLAAVTADSQVQAVLALSLSVLSLTHTPSRRKQLFSATGCAQSMGSCSRVCSSSTLRTQTVYVQRCAMALMW